MALGCYLNDIIVLMLAILVGFRINMTVRVLFLPYTHMSLFF